MAEEEAEKLKGAEELKVCCKIVSSNYRSESHHTQGIQTIHKTAMEASVDIWVWMEEISCDPSLNEELLRSPIKE